MPTPVPAAPTALSASGAQRKVNLKWTQSTSPSLRENRIYRSTTSGGPYTAIVTINAGTSYTDSSLTSGVTYDYVVSAVNSSGKVSAYSNQALAKPR